MENIDWLPKKKNDKFGTLVALSLLTIFFIGKAIIESGHLQFYIICLVLGILAYSFFQFVQKKMTLRPAPLGKAYERKYPIVTQYDPPDGISPAEAGLLYNCSVEPTDLTSLIYQWKFEKLIDIKVFKGENTNRDYVKLVKLDDMPLTRPLFESEIFDSIFRMGDIKIIEGSFQLRYALMLEDLEYHGIQKGWLTYRENKRKGKINDNSNFGGDTSIQSAFFGLCFYVLIFWIMIESLGVSASFSISFTEFLWFIAIIICILIGAILFYGKTDGRSKLKFTEKGAKLASQVIGYSQFIKSCDENKIKLFLKEDPLFIDRTLPYATAFGMETEFLKKISPLKNDGNAKYVRGTKIPSWIGSLSSLVRDDNPWF